MDGEQATTAGPRGDDGDAMRLALRRRQSRSRALLLVLLSLVAVVYATTLARMGERAATRQDIAATSP